MLASTYLLIVGTAKKVLLLSCVSIVALLAYIGITPEVSTVSFSLIMFLLGIGSALAAFAGGTILSKSLEDDFILDEEKRLYSIASSSLTKEDEERNTIGGRGKNNAYLKRYRRSLFSYMKTPSPAHQR